MPAQPEHLLGWLGPAHPGADRSAVQRIRPTRATSLRLGQVLPVAAVEDVLQGKVWAAMDDARRPSKRQKDLADVARLLEAHPDLRDRVPKALLDRLIR